jgi:hypothetical protein
MRRSHPFRFVRRQSGSRRIYYVIYDVNPSRPRSTGIVVDPRDTRSAGPGYDQAVSWAYANQEQMLRPTLTFPEATDKMFTEECAWRRRVVAKGRRESGNVRQSLEEQPQEQPVRG